MTSEKNIRLRSNPGAPRRRWLREALTLALIVIFLLPLPRGLFPGDGNAVQIGREGVFWAMTLALLGWNFLVERHPLRSIGLVRPSWKGLAWGVAAAFVMLAGITFIYLIVFPSIGQTESGAKLDAIHTLPLTLRAAIVLRAAVFEEIFYRGFVIERLSEITGQRLLAALASWTAFTLAHLEGWGVGHLLVAAFGGGLLTALYLWRQDLSANMLAHFLTDAVGLLL